MAEGDVAGIIGAERQADPGQVGSHRIERAGFGVDRDLARSIGAGDPGLQPLHRLHAFVGRSIDRGHIRQRLRVALGSRRILFGGIEVGLARRAAAACIEALQQRMESVRFEESGEGICGDAFQFHVVERDR